MTVEEDAPKNNKVPKTRPLKHEQVAAELQTAIEQGELPAGGRLTGEHDLALQLGVSRGTIRRALEELANRGYISTENGRGSFVTYEGHQLSEPSGWAEALLNIGVSTEVELLRLEFIYDPTLSVHLNASNSTFLAVDRLRRLPDGTAISLERSRVCANAELQRIVNEHGLLNNSLSETMRQAGLQAVGGEQWVQASPLESADAELLGQTPGTLFQHALRITRDLQGLPVEQVSSVLDPTRFRFRIQF